MTSVKPSKLFADGDFPMTFFLIQESIMTRMVIQNKGGRIIDNPQDAHHIIFNRDDGSPSLTPRNNEAIRVLNQVIDWQFVLASTWISECCKQNRLVEEGNYQIIPSSSIESNVPPTPVSSLHAQPLITPASSPGFPYQHAPILSQHEQPDSPTQSSSQTCDRKRLGEEEAEDISDGESLTSKKVKVNPHLELISYGPLKVWIKDSKEYTNIRGLLEPEKTYRKREIFDILVIEIANWAKTQKEVYTGDVGRFCMDDLKKKRPWRDWRWTWQSQREHVMEKLRKLGIDTRTWNTKKGQVEVIYVSDDSDDDQQGGGEGREPGDVGITFTVDGTTHDRDQEDITRVKIEQDLRYEQGEASTIPFDLEPHASSSLRSVELAPADSASNISTSNQAQQPFSGATMINVDRNASAPFTDENESEVEMKPDIESEYGDGQEGEEPPISLVQKEDTLDTDHWIGEPLRRDAS
ncbi:hypothetical protein I203_103238 [Kwoniella mangroviensis CBS 8507]|uniref:uncharacterized protein n=1 Tax=Kwoniella mangroviensis CBS 8507 TaxID=1296122 RepID=UPI00080D2C3A|nr:uncharacterized protein I203_05948 [Kwoniella mangroviensis CBS 8507]OCF64704.1 hypothetical protein I203_05948 [Kwoniella mangroviensis CBS 8507]